MIGLDNSVMDTKSPPRVETEISHAGFPTRPIIALISGLSEDDFIKIFKETNGLQLHRIIKTALDFGKFGDASEEMKNITKNATNALQRIGKETNLNARRVATHGIKVKKEE